MVLITNYIIRVMSTAVTKVVKKKLWGKKHNICLQNIEEWKYNFAENGNTYK